VRTWRLMRVNTEPPFSAASMSPEGNAVMPDDVRLAYDSRRARLAALGSSSSAGVPFDAISLCCSRGQREASGAVGHVCRATEPLQSAAPDRLLLG